ncbi:BRCA1-associated ATM activator 1 isoform X2 [Hoplias malabaricus]
MTKSKTTDSTVFSFTLKLTGLLAAKVDNFSLLKESGILHYMFDPEGWHIPELWKNASVRCAWLHGLWSMLQHQQALDFFCRKGLINQVLCLQSDESLFIASLTNQVLVHFMNSTMVTVLNNCETKAQNDSPDSLDWDSATAEVMNHVAVSLASEEQSTILSGIRLVVVALAQCSEPLKGKLWKHVLEPLDVLVQYGSLTRPILAVLQAVAKSTLFINPECRVEALMEAMLYSRNTNDSVQCAALVLQLENSSQTLKRKAKDVLFLPLLHVTSSSLQPHGQENSYMENQLSQRISCVSLLTQSLSSIADLICKESLADIPVQQITTSVISLLRICIGNHLSTSPNLQTSSHLFGCCKVQRSSLDLLGSLTVYKENVDLLHEALSVLLLYLQCPDLHATVLKKAHEATLKWFSICALSPESCNTISHDIFPLLKKHVCDGRWEVRDSTLEFIMQLTATLKGSIKYAEAFQDSDMISVLFTSLEDGEGYVRASAVTALGQAFTATNLSLCTSLQEELCKHLLNILTQDPENFPRRAAVKVFISWLKSPLTFSSLDHTISSVLSVGSNDFDWEVKVHTLELAGLLMEYSSGVFTFSETTCINQALKKLRDLGVFDVLLKCIFDCDRPVSEKACTLLLKLRKFLKQTCSTGHNGFTVEITRCSWGQEILKSCNRRQQTGDPNCVRFGDSESSRQMNSEDCGPNDCGTEKLDLFKVLEVLDLEDMQYNLSLSSDHVINSPRSIMEDILFAAQQNEENTVDCY